jgi:mRNA-degrading endonuclease RelE of RelBE toxin-antitoxin system
MPYRILLTQDIKRQIQNLPGNIKAIARQQIADLVINPRPSRSKELAGHDGHFRLHIATKYRLVWLILEEDQIVEIEYVGPKSPNLYETLGFARPEQMPPEDE